MSVSFIDSELQSIKDAGLYRRLRRVDSDQDATLTLDGRAVINFSSNNYLGFQHNGQIHCTRAENRDRS